MIKASSSNTASQMEFIIFHTFDDEDAHLSNARFAFDIFLQNIRRFQCLQIIACDTLSLH